MVKKILALVLAVTMVIGLAACTTKPATPSESTGASDSTEPTESTPAEAETVHLLVPYYGYTDQVYSDALAANAEKGIKEGEYADGMQELQMKFTDLMKTTYPNYEMEYADWGWSEQLDQKERAALTAGDPPAILVGEVFVPSYALEGIFSPIPQDIIDAVYGSFLVKDTTDTPVALTTCSALFHMFYNKDVLEQAGFTEADVPTTWSEWKTISDAITAKGAGEYWGGGIPSFPHAGGSLRATPFLRQMGVDWGTSDANGADILSDPKVLETLQYIRDMNKNLPEGIGNGTDESPLWAAWDTEGKGNIAFIIDGTFRGQNVELTGINAGVADLPLPEGGVAGNCAVGAVIVGVPAAFENQEAAYNVVRALISDEVSIGWTHNYRVVPSKKIMDDETVWEGKGATLLAARELYKTADSVQGLVVFQKNSNSIWEIINQKVLAATTMTDDPIDGIVSAAQEEIKALLAE